MQLKLNSKRCFLFVIGSWLVAKLWWTFEMSRLAFYRSLPTKRINHIIYAANLPAMSHWSYEHDRFSILNYDDENSTFVLYKLPELHRN
jgi:hypothetical protein